MAENSYGNFDPRDSRKERVNRGRRIAGEEEPGVEGGGWRYRQ